jgi:hypothetical protein
VDGTFERLDVALRERPRSRLGRNLLPSTGGIADSRSSEKITGVGDEQRGYDGNKKVRGRKRPLLVDTARVSYSGQRSTAPRSWTGTGSRRYCGRYCGRRIRRLPAPNIHGRAPASGRRWRQGLGGEEARMERGARVAPTQARRGKLACGMIRAMVARGRGGRLGEAVVTEGVRSAAAPIGSGTHFCVDLS